MVGRGPSHQGWRRGPDVLRKPVHLNACSDSQLNPCGNSEKDVFEHLNNLKPQEFMVQSEAPQNHYETLLIPNHMSNCAQTPTTTALKRPEISRCLTRCNPSFHGGSNPKNIVHRSFNRAATKGQRAIMPGQKGGRVPASQLKLSIIILPFWHNLLQFNPCNFARRERRTKVFELPGVTMLRLEGLQLRSVSLLTMWLVLICIQLELLEVEVAFWRCWTDIANR